MQPDNTELSPRALWCVTIVCFLLGAALMGLGWQQGSFAPQPQPASTSTPDSAQWMREFPVPERTAVKREVRDSMADVYRMSGFGDEAFNGDYTEVEPFLDMPCYELDESHYLLWNGFNWVLNTIRQDEAPYYTGGSNPNDPSDGAWSAEDIGTPPAGTVTLVEADETAPTRQSAAVNAAGTKVTVTYDEALDDSNTPTGHSVKVNGVAASIASAAIVGATVELTMADTIYEGDTVLESYAPGNVTDEAGNALAAYSDQGVTNNSTQEIPTVTATYIVTLGSNISVPPPTCPNADVAIEEIAEGGVFTGLNLIEAAFDGDSLDLGAARSNGGLLHLHAVAVGGTDPALTVTLEHSADDETFTTLHEFDELTTRGALRVEVARGTEIKRYVRVAVDSGNISGKWAFIVGVAQNKV